MAEGTDRGPEPPNPEEAAQEARLECPVCGAEPEIPDDPMQGELLECPDCGTELEILTLDPITLGEAPEAEEDWGE